MTAAAKARRYEQAAPADVRAEQGLFYTPDAVADVVAEGALSLWRSEHPRASFEGRTVLDPSCGAGALLLAASRALGPVSARLVGRDIDLEALDIARDRLCSTADLARGDALLPGPRGDVVLINPPYGRDKAALDIDRFVTFWRAALARVARGGVLAVLAPRSWRDGLRYAAARKEVVERSGLRSVVDVPRRSFPDAYVDTCVAFCVPVQSHDETAARSACARATAPAPAPAHAHAPRARGVERGEPRLGTLFSSRRGILAPPLRLEGVPLLVGAVVPFVWPRARGAFAKVRPGDVVEGKAALALDRGPRLLVRRIVGRAARLTCVVTDARALVKKDFYILVPRDKHLSLAAYAAYLHARPVTVRLAETEAATTKEDFAQVTLARLRDLRVPRFAVQSRQSRARIARKADRLVDARDPDEAAAWLESWARSASGVGERLARERVRHVDADGRWKELRARLDAFVKRMG